MNARRNDLEIVNGRRPCFTAQPAIQTRIDLLFTMSENPARPSVKNGTCEAMFSRTTIQEPASSTSINQTTWWSQTGSNRRPHACKARALPTELWPLFAERPARGGSTRFRVVVDLSVPPEVSHEVWWAQADSNRRPHAYQACALTS